MRVVIRGIPIINTYVPNGFKIDTPKHEYKLQWYGRLRRYFAQHLSPDKPAIWCGDMNVAPEPIDVHSPEKHLRHVCFHESVRQAYKETAVVGLHGCVSASPSGQAAVHVLGLSAAEFAGEEQGLADRSHPRDAAACWRSAGPRTSIWSLAARRALRITRSCGRSSTCEENRVTPIVTSRKPERSAGQFAVIQSGGLIHQREAFGQDDRKAPFVASSAGGGEILRPVVPPGRELLRDGLDRPVRESRVGRQSIEPRQRSRASSGNSLRMNAATMAVRPEA